MFLEIVQFALNSVQYFIAHQFALLYTIKEDFLRGWDLRCDLVLPRRYFFRISWGS